MRLILFAFSYILLLPSLSALEPVRTWTSVDGRTLEARFVERVGSNVRIKNEAGREFTLPLVRLSKADQEYAAKTGAQAQFRSPGPFKEFYQGAIILVSIKGDVEVIDPPDSDQYSKPGPMRPRKAKTGEVVSTGAQLVTAPGAQTILLLTNGSLVTVGGGTKLYLKEFWQEEFEGNEELVNERDEEISPSRITLGLEFGDLIVGVKKLEKESSFLIESPVGVAGIRGTQFRLFSNPQIFELGVLEGQVDYLDSQKFIHSVKTGLSLSEGAGTNPVESDLPDQGGQLIAEVITRARTAAKEYTTAQLLESAESKNGKQAMRAVDDGDLLENHIQDLLKEANQRSRIKSISFGSQHPKSTRDLRPLDTLPNLETLKLNFSGGIADWSPLLKLRKLKVFSANWSNFKDFNFMKNMSLLEEINIHGGSDLNDFEPIQNLIKLKTVSLQVEGLGNGKLTEIKNLKFIVACRDLENLLIDNRNVGYVIHDLSPIGELTKLRDLSLQNCNLIDLSPLSKLQDLVALDLSRNHQIKDWSPLYKLRKLQTLNLSQNPIPQLEQDQLKRALPKCKINFTIGDLTVSKPGLEEQKFAVAPYVESIIEQKRISEIFEIKMENLGILDDLSPLVKLRKLTAINITNCTINDLSPLSNLRDLKNLTLFNSSFVDDAVSSFSTLSNLQSLYVRGRLETLESIVALKNLESLTLRASISDVTPLGGLKNLRSLHLDVNRIKDPSPLYGLRNLNRLSITSNRITDEDKEKLKRALRKCKISF